jgi:hypothetical protein
LFPAAPESPDRDRLWDFARAWWANDHPDWPIVEGNHDVGPFNRSAAINDAAAKAEPWDVAVIIDSDVLIGPEQVKTAVQLAATSNRMVLAFSDKHMLSDRATQKIMNGFRGNWQQPGWVSRTYKNACSSAVVVNHQLWDLVGGFDENFRGWGWEDIAFRIACETFGDGLMAQIGGPIWHMHHRTSHENNRREPTFQANERRGEAYKATHFDPDGLRRVMSGVVDDPDPELEPSRIPRILHRTIPERVDRKVDDWWEHWRQLHPGWELMTHRDPLDPNDWPETGDLWEQCQSGAQKAGLIRLEALWRWGGVYVDSDVEPIAHWSR